MFCNNFQNSEVQKQAAKLLKCSCQIFVSVWHHSATKVQNLIFHLYLFTPPNNLCMYSSRWWWKNLANITSGSQKPTKNNHKSRLLEMTFANVINFYAYLQVWDAHTSDQTSPVPEALPRLAAWPRGLACVSGCGCECHSEGRIQTAKNHQNNLQHVTKALWLQMTHLQMSHSWLVDFVRLDDWWSD